MTIDNIKEITMLNDISFNYKDKEYFIFLLNDGYNVGQYGNESKDITFGKHKNAEENFNDMIENWIIDGDPLIKLIDKIQINY